jgi:hypothetical protein
MVKYIKYQYIHIYMQNTIEQYLSIYKDSLCRTNDGDPMLLFRGEHGINQNKEVLHTRLGSISFAREEIATIYAHEPNQRGDEAIDPRVLSGYLIISNPIVNDGDDPFFDMAIIEKIFGIDIAISIALKHADSIENTNNWEELSGETGCDSVKEFINLHPDRTKELYCDAFSILDDSENVALFRSAGFDGAIHAGNGASACEFEYKIFGSHQYIPAENFDAHLSEENILSVKMDLIQKDITKCILDQRLSPHHLSMGSILSALGTDYLSKNYSQKDPLINALGNKFGWSSEQYAAFNKIILTAIDLKISTGKFKTFLKNEKSQACDIPDIGMSP